MYCSTCGKEILKEGVVCIHCGVAVKSEIQKNRWIIMMILCWFFGILGIHRFYSGHIATGVIQLLTLGCCGVWTLIDFIIIASGNFKDANGDLISQ